MPIIFDIRQHNVDLIEHFYLHLIEKGYTKEDLSSIRTELIKDLHTGIWEIIEANTPIDRLSSLMKIPEENRETEVLKIINDAKKKREVVDEVVEFVTRFLTHLNQAF